MISSISPLAIQLVQEGAPDFLRTVDRLARFPHNKSHKKIIRTSIGQFYDDAILLYASVSYAASKGVTVAFQPGKANS